MIKINCETEATATLLELQQFQGDLKTRSDKDVDALIKSILDKGLIMPFVIWRNEDKSLILDGHGRQQALIKLALNDPQLLTQPLPVIVIEADTEEDAKSKLLLINSQYGKITKKGLASFTVDTSIDVSGLSIKGIKGIKTTLPKVSLSVKEPTHRIIKIRVDVAIYNQVVDMLQKAEGIEVLI